MFFVDRFWLGRWGHRDFLRGRTKRAGAIHTRHTHGSQGRYKRLSDNFGLRDGRRHAWNHMKGGLGVKLGGGLFGLRIPRQHALSSMSREEYEVAIHGHPNITNPYRHCMYEHPDLKGVMRNASLDVHVVLLMPRVPRVTTTAVAEELPPLWDELLHHLGENIRTECWSSGHSDSIGSSISTSSVKTYFATLSSSVLCRDATHDALRGAAASLFKDLMRGAKLRPPSFEVLGRRHETRRIPLLGASFSTSAVLPKRTGAAITSSTLLLRMRQGELPRNASHDWEKRELVCCSVSPSMPAVTSSGVAQRGVQQLLRDLRQSCPHALNLCIRLEEFLPAGDEEAEGHAAKATPANSPRKLLREEMDPDEVGVWKRPAATVDALMRWQYFNWDPRAHSKDELPHHRRCQSVHIFVDASRVQGKNASSTTDLAGTRRHSAARSLMPPRFSEKLEEMNFKRVSHRGLAETFAALRRWSVDSHWHAIEGRRRTLAGEANKHSHVH